MATDAPTRVTWLYYAQVLANFLALGLLVAVLVVIQADSSSRTQAQTEANRKVVEEVQHDVVVHSRASAVRSCAAATGLQYLIRQSPELDPKVDARFEQYVEASCTFVDPITGKVVRVKPTEVPKP